MKIAIYIDNSNICGVDCRDLTRGNPGIGGTEYCIMLLAQMYKRSYPRDEVILLAAAGGMLPEVDRVVASKDPLDTVGKAVQEQVDLLLISSVYQGKPLPDAFFRSVDQAQLKTVTWGHNFYLADYCRNVARCNYIRANVFVGRQQYDRYIDHPVIHKSTYIYNMYPRVEPPCRTENDGKMVTYIGSIVPTKGFHILANAWKTILAQVPQAQLHVIGSGTLYDRNSRLGSYGIAEESYERSFIQGITDGQGTLLPSVHFHGVLGTEKKEWIAKTSVGVPNPSGRTETFGISALDFSARGVPVVTVAAGGFLDTVISGKTGLLYADPSALAENVVTLLKDSQMNLQYGKAGMMFAREFEPEHTIGRWHTLFEMVCRDEKPKLEMPETFLKSNLKQLRIANRKLKSVLHLEYPLSVIGAETVARGILRRFGR